MKNVYYIFKKIYTFAKEKFILLLAFNLLINSIYYINNSIKTYLNDINSTFFNLNNNCHLEFGQK